MLKLYQYENSVSCSGFCRIDLRSIKLYIDVTNEMAQDNVEVVQDVCGFRWKVEQFHRETKQLTGIEGNQRRKARSVRNTSVAPFWFGFVSNKWLLKRNELFTA